MFVSLNGKIEVPLGSLVPLWLQGGTEISLWIRFKEKMLPRVEL